MSFGKKFLCVVLCLLLTGTGFAVCASDSGGDPSAETVLTPRAVLDPDAVSAPCAILIEAVSGKVLFEKDADVRVAPASVTKIMSLLLIMEALERGDISLEDPVTASADAAHMGGSQIWLEEGEVMSVDMLLKAVCIASANDAVYALAEHLAGSHEAFVGMMNARAAELGMNDTHFVNSCGLDADGHYTTARDMAVCAAKLLRHPLITRYSTVWTDTLRDGKNELVNTNKLVRTYPGITGLKTGTTSKAGSCLVASAEREGFALIAAVFRADTGEQRFAAARTLLNYGYANYTLYTPPAPQEPLSAPVRGGILAEAEIVPGEIVPLVLPKGGERGVNCEVSIDAGLCAPLEKNAVVGSVTVTGADGEPIASYPLVCAREIPKMTWFGALLRLLKQTVSPGKA